MPFQKFDNITKEELDWYVKFCELLHPKGLKLPVS